MVLLQSASGAYVSEFGAHADEAAHYVTGLMVRDYIAGGLRPQPMAFAQKYYDHYPKVALGNWPPLFYVTQAAWTLVFSPSRTSVLLLMALLTSVLAFLVFRTLAEDHGLIVGILGGLSFLTVPLVQRHAGMVMTELPVALCSFLAVLGFARYLERGRTTDSVTFGLFASAAIMTKGSGLALILVPPLAVLFTRRWDLLRRLNFWYPVVIVAILAGPWTWAFRHVARAGWMEDSLSLHYTRLAIPHFTRELFVTMTPVFGAMALMGFAVMLRNVWRGTAPAKWAAAAALVVAVLVFHAIVPAGLESRHLVQALPAWAMFGIAGVTYVERRWATGPASRWLPYGLLVTVVVQNAWMVPMKQFRGFGPVAVDLITRPENQDAVFLISSDASGEGTFIAEMAMREKRPGHVIRRSSKMLASQTWLGEDYKPRVNNAADVISLLAQERIRFVIVDDSIPADFVRPHHQLLRNAVLNASRTFALRGTYPIHRSDMVFPQGLTVYEMPQMSAALPERPGVSRFESALVPK